MTEGYSTISKATVAGDTSGTELEVLGTKLNIRTTSCSYTKHSNSQLSDDDMAPSTHEHIYSGLGRIMESAREFTVYSRCLIISEYSYREPNRVVVILPDCIHTCNLVYIMIP
jgi:hypothetical protein